MEARYIIRCVVAHDYVMFEKSSRWSYQRPKYKELKNRTLAYINSKIEALEKEFKEL